MSSLIHSWGGRSETPREYEKVMVNIGEDPRQCTLEKLLKAREEITTRFLPRLSELVMLLGEVGEGSVLVTWLLPKNLFNILVEGVIFYESQIIFGQSLILQFRFEDSSFPPQFEQISEEGKYLALISDQVNEAGNYWLGDVYVYINEANKVV